MATKKKARQAAPETVVVTLRVSTTLALTLEFDRASIQREGVEFRRALRHRARWAGGSVTRLRMRELALGALTETMPHGGPLADDVQRTIARWLAGREVVELALPSDDDVLAFPWEYVITAAFRNDPTDDPPALLVRTLATPVRAAKRTKQHATYVELAPGPLGEVGYGFDGERALAATFGASIDDADPATLALPSAIAQRVREASPSLIHVAGFDGAQAEELLVKHALATIPDDRTEQLEPARIGTIPTPIDDRSVAWTPSAALVAALTAAEIPPDLVIVNLYDSQASIAGPVVRDGARAALGFQDHIDDDLAECLIREVYRGLLRDEDLITAFVAATTATQGLSPSFHGSGVVLYVAVGDGTLFDAPPIHVHAASAKARAQLAGAKDFVEATPRPELNFALLNNGQPLFSRFYLKRQHDSALAADVSVALFVGGEPYRYQEIIELSSATVTDLAPRISLPITWLRDRMPSECVRATVQVAVSPRGESGLQPYRRQHAVSLLAPDSWRDDDQSRHWLPAFVMPRDPAVRRIIERAQPHLDVLTSQAMSGFDGYQSIDDAASDPFASVDAQVEAIWNGFVVNGDLRYVNPPPSYQDATQRLRSPSAVLRDGRGTCIDLALFFAAALELVGIWPAVFLLEGHCFTGYWRSEEGLLDFLDEQAAGGTAVTSRPSLTAGWLFGSETYESVRRQVRETRQLVPIEATYLTNRQSFRNAVAGGRENLRSRAEFHSLIDVFSSRDHRVTPLPFLESNVLDAVGGGR